MRWMDAHIPSPAALAPGPEETRDSLWGGRALFLQPRRGYRFSIDAPLLAHFLRPAPGERVLDLGAGCGVVGVLLALGAPGTWLTLMEIQPELAELACRNVALNGLSGRVGVTLGDLRADSCPVPGGFDAIACNPPYRPLGAGRLGPDRQRNQARHELNCTLAEWTGAASRWLKPTGRLAVVFPVWRLGPLMAALGEAGLAPARLRLVHARPRGVGRLALVEARPARPGAWPELAVEPPLWVHGERGQAWSDEVAAILAGPALSGGESVDSSRG